MLYTMLPTGDDLAQKIIELELHVSAGLDDPVLAKLTPYNISVSAESVCASQTSLLTSRMTCRRVDIQEVQHAMVSMKQLLPP